MRIKKKYETGTARVFMSRKKAMKKLQLSLRDFRRLCILKGIYPREPAHKKKANKGSTATGIYYHVKDINFLTNEPLINKFREYKIFLRKVAKAKAKHEEDQVKSLFERKPKFRLDGIVKERYPTFSSALRDLDDALCLCFGFAALTQTKIIRPQVISECRRLTAEFMHYVIESQSLRKAFVSIKGIYYQAEIMGEKVTWIVGHERSVGQVSDVDFAVMANFVEFYITMLKFVNFRLYKALGLFYPPQLQTAKAVQAADEGMELDEEELDKVYSLARPLARTQEVEPESTVDTFSLMDSEEALASKLQQLQILRQLFSKCRFFLNREVPKEPLTLIIRSCGGTVSWDGCPVMLYDESSDQITHHVIDRPLDKANVNRIYVQPQWVVDSFNAKKLLPTQRYAPGAALPPHLSPFSEENIADFVSFENVERIQGAGKDMSKLINAEKEGEVTAERKSKKKTAETKPKGMQVEAGRAYKESLQKRINEEGHNLKLKEMLIAKRYRRAYKKIKFGQKREKREAAKLDAKRTKLNDTITVE